MKIVEYKRHLVNGVIADPEFLAAGGGFCNPADHTWIGVVAEDADRLFYVPDTLVVLTLDEAKQRALSIHAQYPFKKLSDQNDPHSSVSMSDTEVVDAVVSWHSAATGA